MARILVVDDEENLRLTYSAFLRNEGHSVFLASDADQALAVLKDQAIDIVFSDIILPRVTGVELLAQIRAAMPDILVIMMTGEPALTTATEALRQGAFDYLVKPINRAALLKTTSNAIRVIELNEDRRRLGEDNRRYQEHLEQLVNERTEALTSVNEKLNVVLTQLVKSFDDIVQALADTCEWRDPYTAGHQRHVSQLAVAITEKLGGSPDDLVKMRVAGMLHDLGKIVVPSEILSKPKKLLVPEFELIKLHSQVGFEILSSIKFAWPIAQIVQQHHIRQDGSGYPVGISPESLLFEAKIIMVADVVEAMSSHRPYRPAVGVEAALREINHGAGTFYHREVVEACIAVYQSSGFQFN